MLKYEISGIVLNSSRTLCLTQKSSSSFQSEFCCLKMVFPLSLSSLSVWITVSFPQDLKVTGGYAHSDALFGIPNYGGKITANVIYADDDGCDGLDNTKGFPKTKGKAWESPFILMIDRGDCTFVSKVNLIVNHCFC